jgi:hypothetical protein
MNYNAYSPLKFVEELSFPRYGGTEAEHKAAQLIAAKVNAVGSAELMPFGIPAPKYQSHVTKVTAPFEQVIDTVPFGLCSAPAPGLDLELYYAERGVASDFWAKEDLSGCVVMINKLTLDVYKELVKRKAAALFVIMGKYYHKDHGEAGMYARNHRPKFLELGAIPAFYISAHDATELLRSGAKTIHIELEQTEFEATSHDVLAVIEGTEKPEESIVITGHYDSLPLCDGAWDNATGSAALMGLYLYFLENAPKRTMYFVWCGSEEQGLLGSKAFIEQHAELVEKNIKFCFNFDMCGTVLGPNNIMITGDKNLEDFVDAFCREVGYSARTRVGVHSSDSAPFADKGIPGIGISRGTKTAEIHTSYDTMFPLGEKALKANICFASKMISRVANSVILPVDTGMPESIKKELDKYFQRTAK